MANCNIARARKHNESFEDYRKNLKQEAADLKYRLSTRSKPRRPPGAPYGKL